jgi:UDP-2,3-diacylglucosamine hydrolase
MTAVVLTEKEQIPIVPAMKDLFLADAHLMNPEDDNYRRLLDLLRREERQVRTLYLLGDIFEFWVGYQHVVFTPYVPILEALRRLHESGTRIVWIEGNHDFHLGPFVRDTLQATIFPEEATITLDGKKIYLCHGDLIDAKDKGYRIYRALLRNRFVGKLVDLFVSPDRLWRFSRYLSARSKAKRGHRPRRDPRPLLIDHARQRFAEGCQIVMTGHFHTPFIEVMPEGLVIALGDAMEQASYVVYEDGTFRLATF